MNFKIKHLMDQPQENHDLQWLQNALQSAIELELSTLPPYLCGLYALQDQDSDVASWITDIVFDEMRHFGLACNLLRATGKQPQIFDGYDAIVYPGPLPGGVRPQCNPTLRFPCTPDFKVVLGFADYQSFVQMCMQIEYPEDPVPRPVVRALDIEEETFPTIGQFYRAVLEAFKNLDTTIPYQRDIDKQLEKGFPKIVKIDGLQAASEAITLIQKQGEGASKFPYSDPEHKTLAHFYTFGQIYYRKKYVFDEEKKTGDWTGDKIEIPKVYPMQPVPLGGYGAGTPAEVMECDRIFTKMLQQLDHAWATGDPMALTAAVNSMTELKAAILDLFQKKQIPHPGGGIYGPQFRKSVQSA